MKLHPLKSVCYLLVLSVLQNFTFAQNTFNFDVKFIRAKFTDTTQNKDLIAVFLLSTADTAHFPPIINMPPKVSILFKDREEKIVLTPEILSVSLDGDKIILKNITVYEIIKGKIDLNVKHPFMIISYTLKDVSKQDFHKIAMSISFSEKHNQARRYEKRFEVEVEK
jgi:hypothetical protein